MVIWKNIEFRNKGIIVEKTPTISKGKKRIDTYEIEGRNGLLMIDKGTYNSFVLSVECHFNNDLYDIDEIKEYLDGYGTLSIDGEREYTAIIQNQIEFEKITNFKKFIVQFLVNPISKDIESTEYEVVESPSNLNINCTANIYPILKIKGSGDVSISINNKTFYLYDLDSNKKYILDCENKEITTEDGFNCSNQMSYDFPYLTPNNNTIEYMGNITEFIIEYKKAYI